MVEHYGDIASVVGLLISAGVFVLSLLTKRAAEEARQAARETAEKFESQLLANEIAASIKLVHEIGASCGELDFLKAIGGCGEVHARMARFGTSRRLQVDEQQQVVRAVQKVADLAKHMEEILKKDRPERLSKRRTDALWAINASLARSQGRLQLPRWE